MQCLLCKLCFLWFAISPIFCAIAEQDTEGKIEHPETIQLNDLPEVVNRVTRQDTATTEQAWSRDLLIEHTTEETWTGRWLPEHTTEATKNHPDADLYDAKHGVKMGIPSDKCDDGKVNITLDWNMSPINYTCYNPSHLFIPNVELPALLETETIPEGYVPAHICLTSPISYDRPIPTFGDHRPLWPKYGEYKFIPKQRWLHSIEHGAVVMLYHPCANPVEVNRLRKLVYSCLRRHIITPYTLLDEQRPMALVAWGARLTMSIVDPDVVRAFLREKSKHGYEGYDSRDGQYDFLLEISSIVPVGSDIDDSVVCPYQ